MNQVLMEQIVRHIFANLGILPASFINQQDSQSILSKEFKLTDKKISFRDGDQEIHRSVFGCQIVLADKEFRILAGDCSLDKQTPEFCVIVHLTGMPIYGMYLVCNTELDGEPLIAVTINEKDWMPCNTFLQSTLLAAMEQLKDIGITFSKCSNYHKHYDILLSMIKFHTNYYEVQNEGQEV